MFVKCLGSGDAFGSGGRLNTSFYLRTNSLGILLDCGASTLIALKREALSVDDVDVILISHLHGDHFGGLVFILCELLAMGKRSKPLTVIGPEQTKERTVQALECFYPGIGLKSDSPVSFMTYTTEAKLEFNSLQLIAYKAVHSPETNPHILRIEVDKKTITYSGDTEWTEDLVTASADADLFICEASSYDKTLKHHLSVKQLAAQHHRITAKRTVLTHPGGEVLKHLEKISFAFAEDGAVLMDEES